MELSQEAGGWDSNSASYNCDGGEAQKSSRPQMYQWEGEDMRSGCKRVTEDKIRTENKEGKNREDWKRQKRKGEGGWFKKNKTKNKPTVY